MDIAAIDIGFGFTKATNGRDFLAFKSIYGEAREIQFREQLLPNQGAEEHLHLEIDGRQVFVGELCERHSNVRAFTLDQNLFIADFANIMGLAALSRLANAREPVSVVTGLPVSFYRRHRQDLAARLKGRHDISVIDGGGKRTQQAINIAQVAVIPQPFGSLFDLIFSDTGEIKDRRFVDNKIGVIDIGFRTADYTIADKTRYSERGSDTTESGISRAFSIIAEHLKEKTGVDVELYRLFEAVERGAIRIHGENIALKDLTAQVFAQLASSIAAEVNRLWADDWDIDLITITGGGGAVLAPYLQPLLKGEVLAVNANQDTRRNNVRGYWKYGRHHWKKALQAQRRGKDVA